MKEDEYIEEEEEETPYITYELFLHYKQGDDFRNCLDKTENVSDAFKMWAEQFEYCKDVCLKLSDKLTGKDIDIQADTHFIGFNGDVDLLEELCKENLLSKCEIE